MRVIVAVEITEGDSDNATNSEVLGVFHNKEKAETFVREYYARQYIKGEGLNYRVEKTESGELSLYHTYREGDGYLMARTCFEKHDLELY